MIFKVVDHINSTKNTTKILYDINGEPQGFVLNQKDTYWYTKNIQGDVTGVSSEAKGLILRYSYDAWGNVTASGTQTDLGGALEAVVVAIMNPVTYRGYLYDMETELYYLQSRYYDANTGRFLSADDTGILPVLQREHLSVNLFAYCQNSPVINEDPDGHKISKSVGINRLKPQIKKFFSLSSTRRYWWGYQIRISKKNVPAFMDSCNTIAATAAIIVGGATFVAGVSAFVGVLAGLASGGAAAIPAAKVALIAISIASVAGVTSGYFWLLATRASSRHKGKYNVQINISWSLIFSASTY